MSEATSLPLATAELAPGDPALLGARYDGEGVLFGVHSDSADMLELCLFDPAGKQTRSLSFSECSNGVWHGYLPGLEPGSSYGFRAHGPFHPEQGHFFNPNRLLLDPYARELTGNYRVSPGNAVASLAPTTSADGSARTLVASEHFHKDNSANVPRSVVVADHSAPVEQLVPARDPRLIYEAHLRGLTALNPDIAESLRGSFAGAGSAPLVSHLRSLGVTSLQLLPIHSFVDEPHLAGTGLSNYWGYNSLNFFTPHKPYASAGACARAEFKSLVRELHDANIEVLLDVVFNHTAEGGADGPSLCYRGLDNASYYIFAPNGDCINDTGCGNTLNINSPVVQRLVLDSLRYWAKEFGVDGFRFDLAVTLGREADGFNPQHALFTQIQADPVLRSRTLIAEPWDVGPGGYQTGAFARPWLEWNDRFRDATRSYWRNDLGAQAELGRRLHGSSDLFEHNGRDVRTSINFITAHDGFTLQDLVSYSAKHNDANGEANADGHNHNLSDNLGVEGVTHDAAINNARDRRARALLATLLLAQGTPMLLAGDEFKNSQSGNNNAYCQDNALGWLDWSQSAGNHLGLVRRVADLRARLQLYQQRSFAHTAWTPEHAAGTAKAATRDLEPRLSWRRFDGAAMTDADWLAEDAGGAAPFALLWSIASELAVFALNPGHEDLAIALPDGYSWQACLDSAEPSGAALSANIKAAAAGESPVVAAQSLSVFLAADSGSLYLDA